MDWTGNIRELRNVIERLIILSDNEITATDVSNYVLPSMQTFNLIHQIIEKFDNLQVLQSTIEKEWHSIRK